MAIRVGADTVAKLYMGSSAVTAAYLGADSVSVGEGGGGGYVQKLVHFDGTQYLTIASFGAPDSSTMFCSFWLNNANDSNGGIFITDPSGAFTNTIFINGFGWPSVILADFEDNNFFKFHTETNINGSLHHVLIAGRTNLGAGSKKRAIYIDGVAAPLTIEYDGDPSFTMAYSGKAFNVFTDIAEDPESVAGTTKGTAADFMFGTADLFGGGTDIPVETLRLFIDADGNPVDPAVAIAALGQQAVRFSGDASTFATNQGNGGAFTLWNGPLTNA